MNNSVAVRAREVATLLMEQLLLEIRAEGWKDPCLTTVMPGSVVPFDYCNQCEEGMAWVRIAEVLPLVSPEQTAPGSPCQQGWSATVEMGMIRGAILPVETEEQEWLKLPTAVDHFSMFEQQVAEMGVMFKAMCAVRFERASGPFNATAYTPVGPEGGCIGGVWTATVGLI